MLDITLKKGDEIVQPNGYVTIKIAVPKNLFGYDRYYVYYEAEDGTLTNMRAVYEDGYVIFTTNHFSTYILTIDELDESGIITDSADTTTAPVSTEAAATTTAADVIAPDVTTTGTTTATAPAADGNGSSGDKNINTGAVLLIIPTLAAATGIIISRKRK